MAVAGPRNVRVMMRSWAGAMGAQQFGAGTMRSVNNKRSISAHLEVLALLVPALSPAGQPSVTGATANCYIGVPCAGPRSQPALLCLLHHSSHVAEGRYVTAQDKMGTAATSSNALATYQRRPISPPPRT